MHQSQKLSYNDILWRKVTMKEQNLNRVMLNKTRLELSLHGKRKYVEYK
jgi:hypothetical protein